MSAPSITVYSKADCVQCGATYRKLDAVGLAYDVVRVDLDPEALQYVLTLGYQAAPVVVVGDSPEDESPVHWSGYRPDLIQRVADVAKEAA